MQVSKSPVIIFIEKDYQPSFGKNSSQNPNFGQINRDQFSGLQTKRAIAIPMPTPWQRLTEWGKTVWSKLMGN